MNELGLPVYVNVNLEYAPFSDSLAEFHHNTPGAFAVRLSLSSCTRYSSSQLNTEIPALFHCKQVLFDVIHYALPCEPIMRAKYDSRGLKEITGDVRIKGWPNESSTYDVCLKVMCHLSSRKMFITPH
jgi:hypothetical protein